MKRRGVSSSKERKKGRGEKRDRRCPTYPSLSGLESSTMLCTVIRENLTVHELAVDSCQKKLVARNKRERRQRHDRFAPSAPSSAQGLGRIGFLLFLLTPTLLNQLHKPVRLPSSLSSHFQQSSPAAHPSPSPAPLPYFAIAPASHVQDRRNHPPVLPSPPGQGRRRLPPHPPCHCPLPHRLPYRVLGSRCARDVPWLDELVGGHVGVASREHAQRTFCPLSCEWAVRLEGVLEQSRPRDPASLTPLPSCDCLSCFFSFLIQMISHYSGALGIITAAPSIITGLGEVRSLFPLLAHRFPS
jgi:hypothetical protein